MKPPFSWLPTWCGISYSMVAAGESRITTSMPLALGTFWPRPKSLTLEHADWLSDFHFPREDERETTASSRAHQILAFSLNAFAKYLLPTLCGIQHTFDKRISRVLITVIDNVSNGSIVHVSYLRKPNFKLNTVPGATLSQTIPATSWS
jgi:hypothetical protein